MAALRFRFDAFVLSPRRRLLTRGGTAVPLIPKYFDLLVLLVERRHEAVSKAAIFDAVWSDVVVSDGALAQAVRTLRRTLGDDTREPRFIRTVSRHGYQFVHGGVEEEQDDDPRTPAREPDPEAAGPPAPGRRGDDPGGAAAHGSAHANPRDDADGLDDIISRFEAAARLDVRADEARDLAERLHAIGTGTALRRIAARPDHARLVALLRDTRWAVPRAGDVPIHADAEGARAALTLVRLRLADAGRAIAQRWAGAALAGASAGAVAGLAGGLVLLVAPDSAAHPPAALALAVIGAVTGATGAAGIGAGLASAEAVARSQRAVALASCGAVAGAVTGGVAHLVANALLGTLFGLHALPLGGALDGLVIGAAAGGGYALATPQPPGGGLAAPSGWGRARAAAIVAIACGAAAAGLGASGRLLIGGLVHEIARTSATSDLVLAPLGRLLGEPDFGPVSRVLVSAFEGAMFGASLAWGLVRRPRPD